MFGNKRLKNGSKVVQFGRKENIEIINVIIIIESIIAGPIFRSKGPKLQEMRVKTKKRMRRFLHLALRIVDYMARATFSPFSSTTDSIFFLCPRICSRLCSGVETNEGPHLPLTSTLLKIHYNCCIPRLCLCRKHTHTRVVNARADYY